jgi:predicted NBD/HSP70 family sugar kinase
MHMLWAIDLGGTKIEGVVLVSSKTPNPLVRTRLPTDAADGYRRVIERTAELVALMEQEAGRRRPRRIGIGTPGARDPVTGLMKNCNTVCLNGMPLKEDLEEALQVELDMANDANCFALAEAVFGSARGYETVFGVIMGTGVGGGICVDGKVLTGLQSIAGEWGHNELEPGGAPCYCGRRGCVETVISGPAVEKHYAVLAGQALSLREIAERDRARIDPAATQAIDELCRQFGRAIAAVINVLDPHVIVLGGGLGNVDRLQTDGARSCAQNVFNSRLDTPFVKPAMGDSAGVFGAALLAK